MPAALAQLPPEQARAIAASGAAHVSVEDPATVQALPEPVRAAIQGALVDSLQMVFLTTALIAIVAVVLTLALPNHRLRGPGEVADQSRLADEGAGDAASEMEAKSQTML
jgi:hypothetical protein